MKKINLKTIFRKKRKVGDTGNSLSWPGNHIRDWKIIVSLFAVGLISLSVFSWKIYLSDKIAGGYLAPTAAETILSVKTVDKEKLNNMLLLLEDKQNNLLRINTSELGVVDPSI